jgi:uncharacterized membrane protein
MATDATRPASVPGQWDAGEHGPAPNGSAPRRLADKLGDIRLLDQPAKALFALSGAVLPEGGIRDFLRGRWMGHPFHPAATDVPIGAWMSASILDLVGGERSQTAADVLVAAGIVAAVPTAASGVVEWSEIERSEPKRVGVVHWLANSVALGFYVASLVTRVQGRRRRGVLLGLGGLGGLAVGGYLGGHLAYGLGVGVDSPR